MCPGTRFNIPSEGCGAETTCSFVGEELSELLEEDGKLQPGMAWPGLEPGTLRSVAPALNHYTNQAPAEVNAIKDSEDEIVRHLVGSDHDLKEFIRECTQTRIFSREIGDSIKKSFEALDSNVPRDVSIRYLLVHVYDGLQGNQRLFEPFLKVLAKYGVPTDLIHKVTQSYTLCLAEDVGGEGGAVDVGSKRPRNNFFLERHISALTEILASQSNKWENIGTFLNLPDDVLKYIFSLIYTRNFKMSLKEVLVQWIVGEHQHAKAPTVENLKATLRSETVGLGGIANQLDDELIKHGICLDDEDTSSLAKKPRLTAKTATVENLKVAQRSSVANQLDDDVICLDDEEPSSSAKRPCLDAPLLDIVSQSLDTSIQEDKSTVLEVQVEARHGTTISYQWLKDDLPLEEGEDFIGINKPILCIINNSCIAKGAYVCKITSEDDLTPAAHVYSKHINVSVSAPPLSKVLVKVLVDRYCAQPEIPEDSWPPRGGNTYINLALIKQGSIEKAGEYARNTIQGDMDDIFANKDSIEYEDVFTNLASGTRLLIEGRPGSGKTTLVHKFSQDWGRGKIQLMNIKLVFLVHLRGFFNDSKIGLRDIVQKYYTQEGKHMVEQILEYSVDHNGEGLCFILDGLDEYNPDSKGQTFIFQLIKKELLPKSIVIVASRPAATAKLRKIATRQVEVIGFLKQQIYEYIEKYQFSGVDKRIDLHKYLDHHPNVHHMCYLPIHAAMVCYLFDKMGSKLPRTETKMYTEFTHHTLLRTLTRYKEKITYLESPDQLLDQDKEIFCKICELAFEKTAASRQVLRKSEIPHFSDISSGSESMGLITVDEMASLCGFENLYTFLHLTFQEYLAAYHISKLEEEKQLEVITQYSQKKHMTVVWKFYCGLVNFNEQDDRLKNILSFEDDLFNVHCAFESQQTVTCDSIVMAQESGTLSFNSHFLTPSDSTAIGYVVKNAKSLVEKVVLNRCKLSKEGIKALIDEAGDKISSIKALSFHRKDCLMEQFKLLNTCLHSMESLEVLDISHTNLGKKKMKLLTENLTLPNLQTLKLSSSMLRNNLKSLVFGSPTFRQVSLVDGDIYQHQKSIVFCFGLSTFLSSCDSQAHIKFQDHHFKLSELEVLSNSISQFSYCTTLCLNNCNIGDNVGALKNLALLESFDVGLNGISDSGATAVADNIQHCKKLQNLNMSFNHIGNSGAMVLAESLQLLINLKKLDLSYNRIGDEGAIAVTRAIKDFQDFELLLWNHRITKEGVGTVTDLKPDIELKVHVLNLMDMSIVMLDILVANIDGDSEQLEIFNFKGLRVCLQVHALLKQCMYLEEVNLWECNFLAFVDSIKHCTELQTLHLEGSNIDATSAQSLANLIKHYPNLLTLNLCKNNISPCGAKALADGLMHCTNLQVLNLSENSIGIDDTTLADVLIAPTDGIYALADGLKHCTNLQTLHLDQNGISDDGAKTLAGGLKHCTNLQTLLLGYNKISYDGAKSLADCLKHCTNLQTLHLDRNEIGDDGAKALADVFKHCTNLQTLHLDGNEIGANGAKALADGLKHCTNLQTLCLNHNKIGSDGTKALADGLKHCTNLQELYLNHNEIGADGAKALAGGLNADGAKTMAGGLKHCTNLQILDLDNNSIGTDGAKALADCLSNCTSLRNLYLGSNSIHSDGVKALADSLKSCTNLEILYLENNDIAADCTFALATCLKQCPNLQRLDLDNNSIGTDGARALADCLNHCTDLRMLFLCNNSIHSDGVKALADCLKHCTNLQMLDLENNSIHTDGVKALADCLSHGHFTDLRDLYLDNNSVGPDGVKALAEGLKSCTNLETLFLRNNDIDADGAKALATCLKQCPNLQTLYLHDNTIGTDGARALADCLKHCTNLHVLGLFNNSIGTGGARALADCLSHCTNLKNLTLGNNSIGTDGAKAFADCLSNCTNLTILSLSNNSIHTAGVKALADSLKCCANLETLLLKNNDIDADGAKALATCLKQCPNLQTLDLDNNTIGTDGARALAECLSHCTDLRKLFLGNTSIHSDGVKGLSNSLKCCTNLEILSLKNNGIYADGAFTLATCLKQCPNLQTLDLENNSIGTDGARALADCLKHCTNLKSLDLGNNSIHTDGVKALADCLSHGHFTDLRDLYLNNNSIGPDGVKALSEGLKSCTNLEILLLSNNGIDADGAKALATCLKQCPNLQTLDLDDNTIGTDGARALADCLNRCTDLRKLFLGNNSIHSDGVKGLSDSLKSCTNLEILYLKNNDMGADGAKALATCLN